MSRQTPSMYGVHGLVRRTAELAESIVDHMSHEQRVAAFRVRIERTIERWELLTPEQRGARLDVLREQSIELGLDASDELRDLGRLASV